MTIFWLGILFISGLAAFFCLKTAVPTHLRDDIKSSNLAWYKIRRLEISREGINADELSNDAKLQATSDITSSKEQELSQRGFSKKILAGCVTAGGLVIYLYLGSIEDVVLSQRIQAMESGLDDSEISSLISSIENRIADRPKNPDYLNLSAQYRLANGDFDMALQYLRKLVELMPDNPYILATAARASFFANERQLNREGTSYAQQALELDPNQSIVLGILGFAAFSEQNYPKAIDYFTQLLAVQNPSPEERLLLESYIDKAKLFASDRSADTDTQVKTNASLFVKVSIPLNANLSGTETVFLSVRDYKSTVKMPILAVKRSASDLPFSMFLDDSHSMTGKSLSDLKEIVVVAYISPSGNAGETFATWEGSSGPIDIDNKGQELDIRLRRKDF